MTAHKKPRVLVIGESCGRPETDAALRDIADVTVVPRGDNESTSEAIRIAVEERGPFIGMAVSHAEASGTAAVFDPGRGSSLNPHRVPSMSVSHFPTNGTSTS